MKLHYFSVLTACAGFVLVIAGALVTSTGSGLAVPDWPLSFGQFFPKMEGGVFYEHGHRVIAGVVGILTIVLAVWIWLKESRKSVKVLALLAVLAVVVQAVLGGLTVLYQLPTSVSAAHACLGQVFFSLLVSLAWVMVPGDRGQTSDFVARSVPGDRIMDRHPSGVSPYYRGVRSLALFTVSAIFIQLFLGAWMRHADAGLAIPDFPLSFGRLIPSFENQKVALHFAHRANALLVGLAIGALFFYCLKFYRGQPQIFFPAAALTVFFVFQILFGALIIWSQKAVFFTTAHVAIGALTLAASFLLALPTFDE